MSKEAMKLALEALELEDMACRYEKESTPEHIAIAITALREALAEQPAQQEPVAWVCYGAPGKRDIDFEEADINGLPIGTLLYTSPPAQRKPHKMPIPPGQADMTAICYAEAWNACCDAFFGGLPPPEPLIITVEREASAQRTWVGLTDEELRQVWYDDAPVEGGTYIDKLRQVEAKLKEKNT